METVKLLCYNDEGQEVILQEYEKTEEGELEQEINSLSVFLRQAIGRIERKISNRCQASKNEFLDFHLCPHQEDINGEYEDYCQCCEVCTEEYTLDV